MDSEKPKIVFIGKTLYNKIDHFDVEAYAKLAKHVDLELVGLTTEEKYRSYTHRGYSVRGIYIPKYLIRKNYAVNALFAFKLIFYTILNHIRKKPYKIIISKDPQFCGVLGLATSKILKCKLIVELNGNYVSKHVRGEISNTFLKRLKSRYAKLVIPIVLKKAAAIKVLYPGQEKPYLSLSDRENLNIYCFHNPTQLPVLTGTAKSSNFIMSMGYPYEIKGFDILIKAFNAISDNYPGIELHLVGYMLGSDRHELENLKLGNENISIFDPLEHHQAMQKLENCLFFVLASRTEAMGRVLLEAMALKKAVIGSRVDGIPYYVQENQNGLLFDSEDISQLERKLKILIEQPDLRSRLGDNGYALVNDEYSEERYVEHYNSLIKEIL